MRGPCAKTVVTCLLVMEDGDCVVGTNECRNAQEVCPRLPGEDYTKCRTVCLQEGHAETMAIRLAGPRARGATAYMTGNTYFCRECQEALQAAGVKRLVFGMPGELT